MSKTFDSIPLRITPLTPVHVGCGMDFDPTNYVIDGALLYHFDPALAALADADRGALRAALQGKGPELLLRVQRFFHERKDAFKGVASGCVAVCKGVAAQYEKRIGTVAQKESDGGRVVNMLEIERTAHHPHSGIPYLPGSSLKGAMRTAWLDKLNGGSGKHLEDRGAADMERRLLGGGFHEDPFRLIRMADAAGDRVASKVFFSTNHKKRVVTDKAGNTVVAKGVAARREAILGGQLRAFAGEIRFDRLVGVGEPRGRDGKPLTPGMTRRIGDFAALSKACNAYYLKRFEAECAILDSRRFVDPDWLASIRGLLQVLRPAFDEGKAMLLRVGRHSGAESVTLDGVRNITIMAGKGQQAQRSSEGAKTVWLAAETEQDRSGMLPFGWLLVEMEASKPAAELEAWCERQPKPDLDAVRANLAEARKSAAEDADRRRMAERERAAAQVRAAQLAAEREARLLAMSENARAIAALVEACEARAHEGRKDPLHPGQGLYAKAIQLSRHALADGGGWSAEDRLALAEAIETWLPKSVERLDRKDDWKDARKRLRLAELRPDVR